MITLEPITPSLANAFRSVRLRALSESPLAFGSTHAKESLFTDAEWVERAAKWNGVGSVGYLAFDGDQLEEACGIAAGYFDGADQTAPHLVSMWVAPSHRGQGVGKLLINSMVAWAASMNAPALRLMVTSNNDLAIGFYGRLGFSLTGRVEPYPNDDTLQELEMQRAIG